MKMKTSFHLDSAQPLKDWLSKDYLSQSKASAATRREYGALFLKNVLGYESKDFEATASMELPDFLPTSPSKTPWVLYVDHSGEEDLSIVFNRRCMLFQPDKRAKGIRFAIIIGKTKLSICSYESYLEEINVELDSLTAATPSSTQVLSWQRFLERFKKQNGSIKISQSNAPPANPLAQTVFHLGGSGWTERQSFQDQRFSTASTAWNRAHSVQKWKTKATASLSCSAGRDRAYLFECELTSSRDLSLAQSARCVRSFANSVATISSKGVFSSLLFITEKLPSKEQYWLFYLPSNGEILNPLPPLEAVEFSSFNTLPDRWVQVLKTKLSDFHLAFRREILGNLFYDEYAEIWKNFSGELPKGIDDPASYSQLVLSRLLFLRYMEQHGHLNHKGLLRLVSNTIKDNHTKTSTASELLNGLWFEALAKPKKDRESRNIPNQISLPLSDIAYWNGGLFRIEKGMDDIFLSALAKSRHLSDSIINVFDWLERWEIWGGERGSVELVPEIAGLDRSLLGSVFERILQLSGSEKRHDNGQYYTSPEYIQYIVEEALAEFLQLNKPAGTLDYLKLVRQFRDPDKKEVSPSEANKILAAIRPITWLDPAVGTNGFGEGALSLHVSFASYLAGQSKADFSAWTFAKQVAANQIHGVDLEPRGIELSKLRIFLALATAVPKTAIRDTDNPILPNLDLCYRQGNSLCTTNGPQPFLTANKATKGVAAGKEFRWDSDFNQVCKRGGWDIVVSNFPFVRQERTKNTTEDSLFQQITGEENGGRADYCTNFMAGASSLVKPNGVACYLTTLSWAEADYGDAIQRYLVSKGGVIRITENRRERVFENAKVNPLIVTCINPKDAADLPDTVEAVGLMRKIRTPETLQQQPNDLVVNVKRTDLEKNLHNPWAPYKWAGPLMRSPQWFTRIIEKGLADEKLVRLQKYRDGIQRGITTNCNPFFYVDLVQEKANGLCVIQCRLPKDKIKAVQSANASWRKELGEFKEDQSGITKQFTIEKNYLVPLLQSPKELKGSVFRHTGNRYFIALPEKIPTSSYAADYVRKWGNVLRFNKWVVSLKGREAWWTLSSTNSQGFPSGTMLWLKGHSVDRLKVATLSGKMAVDCNLFTINVPDLHLDHLLASSIWLQRLIVGKTSMADGLVKTEIPDFEWIAIPQLIKGKSAKKASRDFISLFESYGNTQDFFSSGDELFKDTLGLTNQIMKDILASAYELNQAHLERASGSSPQEALSEEEAA